MALAVEVEGLKELMSDVKQAGGNAEPLVKGAITNSVNHIQSEVRARARHRTGTLQRSVLAQVDYPVGEVTVQEKYGPFIEEGTGIYGPLHRMITPKRAKALAFTSGVRKVFARAVKGMRASPFFRPGVEASVGYINDQFNKVMDRIVKELAGR